MGWGVTATVGIALTVGALFWYLAAVNRFNDWATATGTVVEVRGASTEGFGEASTTIRFQDGDAIEYEFDSAYGDRSTREGDEVQVRYPLTDPNRAATDDDRNQDVLIWWLLVAAGALIAAGSVIGGNHHYQRTIRRIVY